MVGWDPAAYLDFAAERSRPFADLLDRVLLDQQARHIVDLGCGPGTMTVALAERWPQAMVLGIDSSPEMIARADDLASSLTPGRLQFSLADLRDWRPPAPVDLLITNATLQWVPGHLELLSRWVETAVRPGGWLALQVPGNHTAPMHTLLAELICAPQWADRLSAALDVRAEVPDPADYLDVLAGAGCSVDAWETTYHHVLDPEGRLGPDAALAWATGTALRPVLDLLPEKGTRATFLDEYAARLRVAYPRRPWGTVLGYRRIFAVAQRPE